MALIWFSGEYMVANGQWGLNVLQTADHKLHHTFIEAVCLGILANLMVCLAVWMSLLRPYSDRQDARHGAAGRDVCRQRLRTQHRQHVYDPMGIVVKHFATPEFWQAVGAVPEQLLI